VQTTRSSPSDDGGFEATRIPWVEKALPLADQVGLLGGGRREEGVGAVLDGREDGARVEADEGRSSIITGQIEDYEVLS
jgi:hypothetical protein